MEFKLEVIAHGESPRTGVRLELGKLGCFVAVVFAVKWVPYHALNVNG